MAKLSSNSQPVGRLGAARQAARRRPTNAQSRGRWTEALHPRSHGKFSSGGGGGGVSGNRKAPARPLGREGKTEGRKLAGKLGERLRRFQREHNLPATGEVTGDTLLALRGATSRAAGGHTPSGWGKRPSPAKYPVDKWNALPAARRLKLARDFAKSGGKLPKGLSLGKDGTIKRSGAVQSRRKA